MFKNEFVVKSDFLLKNRDNKNFVVIDARGLKLTEDDFIYDNAIVFDYKEFSFLSTDVGDPYDSVPYSKDVLLEKFLKYGIDKNKVVLVYTNTKDNNSMGEDGRIKYLLNLCDISCFILDGGVDEILKTSHYKKNEYNLDVSVDFVNKPFLYHENSILTDEFVKIYKEKDVKILDVRDIREYNGTLVFDDYVGGHVKGAINFSHLKIYDKDGFLLDNEKIENMILSLGISKKDKIITYCSSGVRATLIYEILTMLGFNVRVFHESFARLSSFCEVEM